MFLIEAAQAQKKLFFYHTSFFFDNYSRKINVVC